MDRRKRRIAKPILGYIELVPMFHFNERCCQNKVCLFTFRTFTRDGKNRTHSPEKKNIKLPEGPLSVGQRGSANSSTPHDSSFPSHIRMYPTGQFLRRAALVDHWWRGDHKNIPLTGIVCTTFYSLKRSMCSLSVMTIPISKWKTQYK